jgi:hypothetical protein
LKKHSKPYSFVTIASAMTFFRQHIAPFLVVLVFVVALVAVSARIFLPGDMAAPAPVEEVGNPTSHKAALPNGDAVAGLPPALSALVRGLPADPAQF